jgi:hypothetical protein
MQSKTFVLQPLAARSVRSAGPVQCVPIVDALAANMAMPTLRSSFPSARIHLFPGRKCSSGYPPDTA